MLRVKIRNQNNSSFLHRNEKQTNPNDLRSVLAVNHRFFCNGMNIASDKSPIYPKVQNHRGKLNN